MFILFSTFFFHSVNYESSQTPLWWRTPLCVEKHLAMDVGGVENIILQKVCVVFLLQNALNVCSLKKIMNNFIH